MAQFGRALGSGPRGRVFKSPHSDHTQGQIRQVRFDFIFFAEKLKLYGKIKIRILEGEDNMIEFKFLGEKEFYNEF